MTAIIFGLVFVVASLAIVLVLKKLSKERADKFVQMVKKKIMWSPVLRGQIQTYFQSCLLVLSF